MYEELFFADEEGYFRPDEGTDDDHEPPRETFDLFSNRSMIIFQTIVVTGCFLVLGGLTIWHAKLISKGETSIEAHINRYVLDITCSDS